jgi:hypothetical protein
MNINTQNFTRLNLLMRQVHMGILILCVHKSSLSKINLEQYIFILALKIKQWNIF